MPTANGKERPTSLDYFRADGQYAALFHKELGPNPRSLPIIFLSDDLRECCHERYELRQGSKLYAEGDGETFKVWSATAKKYVTLTNAQEPGLGARLKQEAGGDWQTILTLRFLILPLRSVWGCWSFSTKGEASSIPSIVAAFDAVKGIAKTVVGVPFDLTVKMVKSQKPGSESKYPVVRLVPNVGETHLQMLGELKEQGRTFHKALTAEVIEKEVAALPAPGVK